MARVLDSRPWPKGLNPGGLSGSKGCSFAAKNWSFPLQGSPARCNACD